MKIILLDIGNVVLNVNFSLWCNVLSGGNAQKSNLIYQKYCIGKIKSDLDCGRITPDHFFATVASDDNAPNIIYSEVKKHWINIFTPFSSSRESIEKLKKHYSIWIVSDTDPIHFNFFINEFPFIKEADRFYLSYSVGILKNDPHFFNLLLENSDVGSAEFILIDDKEENCRSAAQNGIASVLFKDWKSALNYLLQ
jgi:FMN phosphatase YigB (HAD superfamily)